MNSIKFKAGTDSFLQLFDTELDARNCRHDLLRPHYIDQGVKEKHVAIKQVVLKCNGLSCDAWIVGFNLEGFKNG